MMGLHSPSLVARCEISTGGTLRTSSCTPSQQHLDFSCTFLHSANASSASQVGTVPGFVWYQRRKLKNVLGIYSDNLLVTIPVVKLSWISQQVQQQQGRGSLCNFRRQSQHVSSFINYPNYHGEANRFQFLGASYSTIVQSSTRIGIQQPLAASSLPRSLEDELSEGTSKDQDDSRSDTNSQLGSVADLNRISSLQVNSEESTGIDDEQRWQVDDEVSLMTDIKNVPPPKRKRKGSLGVRKPLPEAEKADFATRFGLSAHLPKVPASDGQASQSEAAGDIEYYEPKVGDEVIGVVVSGNEFKLDVDIGSQQLGRILTKDVYPLDLFGSDECFWESSVVDGGPVKEFPVGRVRVVRDDEDVGHPAARAPIVEVESVLVLKVLGVTLSGRPILSSRKIAFPLAWERVRQIRKQNEPIEVQICEWNSGGLLTKIEGLRAFLPLNHFLNRAMGTGALKARVGERIRVLITEVDEQTGKLIISEKRAWGLKNLLAGSLHDGVVNKIFPFGVEVTLAGTSLRGMIHISNVSRSRVKDLEQVFSESEPVKVMVVKSPIPHRLALSTADLESTKGLILEDKEKVFAEAAEMALRFRSNLHESDQEEEDEVSEDGMIEHEIANSDWLDFGEEMESVDLGQANHEQ